MSKVTRGEFLGFGAAAAAALTTGCAPGMGDGATASAATADLVVLNARVLTLDDDQPLVEAFAVKNGRITALGSSQDIRNLVGSGTEVIEASGTTVTPGFIDAHSHPSGGGLSALRSVDCNLGSVSAIKAALAERANQTPPGEWVIGYMYDDTKLSEGRALLRTDIDEAVSDHPVHVRHRGGHTAVYNSAAFRVAGVTVNTPDPFGGHFYRADGQLTGKVAERANAVITRHIPSTSTREERQAGVKKIGEMMNAVGLTSVHQTGTNADGYIAYQDARAAGELTFRGYLMARGGA
ncbi:MAG: putative amidohydrolase YtcJ, partial [Myxococcota bacterium]